MYLVLKGIYKSTIFYNLSRHTLFFYVILPIISFWILFATLIVAGSNFAVLVIPAGLFVPVGFFIHAASTKRSSKSFFKRYGYSAATMEYMARVRFVIVTLYIFVVSISLPPYIHLVYSTDSIIGTLLLSNTFSLLLLSAGFTAFYSALTIGIKIVILRSDRYFDYHLTLGYLELALKQDEGFAKSRLFRSALRAYDGFLKKVIKFQIKDLEKIFLLFMLKNNAYRNKTLRELYNTLSSESPSETLGLSISKLLYEELNAGKPEVAVESHIALSENSVFRKILTIIIPTLIGLVSLGLQIYRTSMGH